MASRSPTTFTKYVDRSRFMPRNSIVFTEPDQVLDDQEMVIDVPRLIVAAMWRPIPTTATARTWLRSVYTLGRDMCGLSSTENCDWAVLAWTDAATNFVVELANVGAGMVRSVTVSSSHTTKQWRGWQTGGSQIQAPTDGTEEEFQIGGYTTGAGGETVYIAGLAILAG